MAQVTSKAPDTTVNDTNMIAIAMVTNRQVKPRTVLSLAKMIEHTKEDTHTIVSTEGYTTAEGRSYCVIQALKHNCSHILFIDDDMTFPEDTIERLLAHGKEIVGVNSMSRTLPLTTTVALLKDGEHWPHDHVPPYYKMPTELFEVYSIGMGVALIDLSIFDTIEKPWFKFHTHESGKILIGEDAWMCLQARNKGYKIWCDPTLSIGHWGEFNYSNDDTSDAHYI